VLADPAAEPLAAPVAPRVGDAEPRIEPAEAAGLAAADGAESVVGHGANLAPTSSVKRPEGRMASSDGTAWRPESLSAAATVSGTSIPGARRYHHSQAFRRA